MTDRPPSLRDQIAQAMRDANGTPEALAAWQRHPQLVPVDVYADAVLPVIEAHIVLAHVDATQRADLLAGRLEQAERERDTAREALDAAGIVIASLRDQRDEERAIRQQAEEIIAIAHDTSNRSERERVRAVQRAETAERQHAEALDQIATERRARLAAEAAVRRGREIHRRHDCARHVSAHTPVPCVNEGLCDGCAARYPCQTATALKAEQPKETPPAEHVRGANAEDCPACVGRRDLPYPFICPGTDPAATDTDTEDPVQCRTCESYILPDGIGWRHALGPADHTPEPAPDAEETR